MTEKQFRLLKFIHKFQKENVYPPSFEEIREALGYKSKSVIFSLIDNLEEQGYIRRLPKLARAIEITEKGYRSINDKITIYTYKEVGIDNPREIIISNNWKTVNLRENDNIILFEISEKTEIEK